MVKYLQIYQPITSEYLQFFNMSDPLTLTIQNNTVPNV